MSEDGEAALGFEVLYESGPCLVVAKPGGVLTQAPPGIDSLEQRVKEFLRRREGKTGRVYLGVPHRLDRPVSGALVLARHVRAARRLCEQFEQRLVQKTYWALVAGHVAPTEGLWCDTMRKVPDEPRAELLPAEHPAAREARLRFRVLEHLTLGSLLEIDLETGRMHQIRLQAASRGHPIWGDELYGSTTPFGAPVADKRARWIALHARRLAFHHPMTREPVDVTAPVPDCWPVIAPSNAVVPRTFSRLPP